MKNIKKFVALTLAMATILTLCSCEANKKEDEPPANIVNKNTEEAEESVVLYDEDGIKLTAVNLSNIDDNLYIDVENKTDKNLILQSFFVSADTCSFRNAFYANVDAHSTKRETMTFDSYLQDLYGINLNEIKFQLNISEYINDSCEFLYRTPVITVKRDDVEYKEHNEYSGEAIYNENGVKLIYTGIKNTGPWEDFIVFYVENNTEEHMFVLNTKTTVNGKELFARYTPINIINAGDCGVYILGFDKSKLEEMGINDISEITEIQVKFLFSRTGLDAFAETDVLTINVN